MALQQDIEQSFKDNLDNAGTIEDITSLLVSNFKDSVKSGKDQYGNSWEILDFSILENSIIEQFNISQSTKEYLQFNIIELGLIATWATAILKSGATPAPGMSVVNTGTVISSSVVGTSSLSEPSEYFDNISVRFADVFINHAKTLTYQYIGTSTSTPPVPIVVPGSSFNLM